MSSWGHYCQIYNLGHRAIADLLRGPVIIEEKIDGSQFSFGLFTSPDDSGTIGEIMTDKRYANN